MSRWFGLIAAGVCAAGMSIATLATPKSEIGTAHAYAAMAHSAQTVNIAHVYLQHAVNCLVGPGGKAFDSGTADPCKGQGNGAIPDTRGNAAVQGELERALAAAQAGLKSYRLKEVQVQAASVAATLQGIATQTIGRAGSR